ncbi:MAG: arginine N-succinyltransferase [Phycisphaerales bacterium]|nr:arginine N-succinyltransferase [Phycisphaerales bacterium]
MFLMRRAKPEDVPTLLKLAKLVHFINLPADKDIIAEKVQWSRQCFLEVAERVRPNGTLRPAAIRGRARASTKGDGHTSLLDRSRLFMFVLEDTESGGVLGTSQIITSMGGVGHPNLSFELSRKEMFSTSLQMGTTHMVAKLRLDESGPTEIGGLILQPSYRGHKARLGRFLSLVRFHFMGLFRPMVADHILAEMMGPITPDGQNTLWEYLGRRFINLTYIEADRFCQHSKEFMLSLLPREEIYLTLLPPEARRIIAQVGPETEPAKKLLEKLGFQYRNRIDPFDGGPNLEAATDDISLVKATRRLTLGAALPAGEDPPAGRGENSIFSALDEDGEFRAIETVGAMEGGPTVRLPRAALDLLQVRAGSIIGCTPLAPSSPPTAARSKAGRGSSKSRAR